MSTETTTTDTHPAGQQARALVAAHFVAHRPQWVIAALLSVVASLAALSVPWVVGQSVAQLFDQGPELWLLVALALVVSLRFVADVLSTRGIETVEIELSSAIKTQLYRRMHRLPIAFYDRHARGDLVSLLGYDAHAISGWYANMPAIVASASLTLVGALLAMASIDPLLTGGVVALAPLTYLFVRLLGRRLSRVSRDYWDAEAQALTIADADLEGIRLIRANGRDADRVDAYADAVALARRLGLQRARIVAVVGPTTQVVTILGVLGIVWVAQATASDLSPEQLITFVLYGLLVASPLRGAASVWTTWQETRAAFARLGLLFETPPERETGEVLEQIEGRIEFAEVAFGYGRESRVLDGISFVVEPGETVALVGPNGGGKTTLLQLLAGFYEPTGGAVRVDGHATQDIALSSLRRHIAMVTQDTVIFDGTIEDNIRFARPEADASAVADVSARAGVQAFADTLDKGLQTTCGEGGVRLSGGQRQRVALARALLREAPILLLDEAMSMLDPDAELAILSANADVLATRTVLMITHRSAPLATCHRILELRDGTIHARQSAPTVEMQT